MNKTLPSGDDLAILVVAAGRGVRAGGGLPKQYKSVGGRPLLAHTLEALARSCPGTLLQCAIHPDDEELYSDAVRRLAPDIQSRLLPPVHGGATRQASVRLGLESLATRKSQPRFVLIHDAARPFVSTRLIESARAALASHPACAPGALVTDAIKEVAPDGRIKGALDRDALRAMQTPQAFAFDLILAAHRAAAKAGRADFPDDVAVADFAGSDVYVFAGDPMNVKITQPEDFAMAESRLANPSMETRVGQGFDVHAFAPGDKVWLGGVAIPHDQALSGHSDADVLMHAITDAILGALADGDIGSHFPPSDPQWKGAASEIFLRRAMTIMRERGGVLLHIDGTVICERPKVGPHRDSIRARLAEIMGVAIDRVAVKATTSERLGFTGRGEGIAAMAIATLRLPAPPQEGDAP